MVDTTGKAIAGATITVTCPEAPTFKKVIETEPNGGFRLLLLDATKSYDFHVQAAGYAPYDHMIKVGVGTMDNEFTFSLQSDREAAASQQQAILQQPGYKELDEGLAARRYDARPGTAYLIRPDQHVAARWRTLEPARVRAALDRATGRAPAGAAA